MLRRRKIAELDAFPKVDESYLAPSTSGGWMTLATVAVLLLLVVNELLDYRSLHVDYEFLVDHRVQLTMDVHVDITVAMECKYLTVDILDTAGAVSHARDALILKPTYFHGFSAVSKKKAADPLSIDVGMKELALQAENELPAEYHIASTTPGCTIKGELLLNRVSGNLHITALGYGYGYHGDVAPVNKLNFSHRIDLLTFGEYFPNVKHPLSYSYEIIEKPLTKLDYFLSVVPTIFIDVSGKTVITNQYAVTDYKTEINHAKGQHGAPGIFFKYSIEPISVRITESHKSFIQFFVRLCGIIGGMYVCVGNVHRLIRYTWEHWDKNTPPNQQFNKRS